jgi:hypothetical protein
MMADTLPVARAMVCRMTRHGAETWLASASTGRPDLDLEVDGRWVSV